jgi:predicted Rossmann fold nucleotide-binding protein DprA/Smf involved in DNA uptake
MQHAAYWITISHLKRWTNAQINELIKQIYHVHGSDLPEFFTLDIEEWKNIYSIDDKQLPSLLEAKGQIANNAFLAEDLYNQGFELIPLNASEYSPTMKDNLKLTYSPPLLYIKGNKQLLLEDSIAIVGSRNASTKGLKFTENVAKKASADYKVIVSGFAKGIDKAALDNAIKYHGHSIIVLPQGVMTFGSGYKTYYKHIIEGDVLVLSTFHPKAPWKVELAMARNPIIYGLAKEIFVADSSSSGGTWSGVKDGLRKGRTIYVRRSNDDESSANNLLIDLGGVAVDEYGKPESQRTTEEKVMTPTNKQDDLPGRIIDLLTNATLTAKEICDKLEIDISPKSMAVVLGQMDQLEKVKIGRSFKYRLRQQEIFDLD